MISVAIMAHVVRQHQAHLLARQLGARLFLDSGELGEVENARRAWSWGQVAGADWHLVIQDDAVPIPRMHDHLNAGLSYYLPSPGLVSLYLGTSYPTHWQARIRRALDRAGDAAWIQSDHLLHGVAVAAPVSWIPAILHHRSDLPYDEHLGQWARSAGHPIWYTRPSLVDHEDGPSLIEHPDRLGRTKPRRAWQVGIPAWNRKSIRL